MEKVAFSGRLLAGTIFESRDGLTALPLRRIFVFTPCIIARIGEAVHTGTYEYGIDQNLSCDPIAMPIGID
jgi:hypothetical protein